MRCPYKSGIAQMIFLTLSEVRLDEKTCRAGPWPPIASGISPTYSIGGTGILPVIFLIDNVGHGSTYLTFDRVRRAKGP